MKKGDIVEIYQKWITKQEYEGKAKLIKKLDGKEVFQSGKIGELWEVRFPGDGYTVTRWILVEGE